MKGWLIFLSLCAAVSWLPAQDVAINGVNEAIYTYRAAEDSLANYFEDEFQFNLLYRDFTFGMKYIANYPKYDAYQPMDELHPSKIGHEWDELYVQYAPEHLLVKAGTLSMTYGRGMFLSAKYDDETDQDTRLEGFQTELYNDEWRFQGVYATLPTDLDESKDHVVGGVDIEYLGWQSMKVALSGMSFQNWQAVAYNRQDVFGGRFNLKQDFTDCLSADLYVETGWNHIYNQDNPTTGEAVYGSANLYMGSWTFSASGKHYNEFGYVTKLNDLPTVNYSEEPLSESMLPGSDEIGLMGEVHWENEEATREFTLNYSEAWDLDESLFFSDFYGMVHHELGETGIKWEVSSLEHLYDHEMHWTKELKPAVSVDFNAWDTPVLVKGEYEYKEKKSLDRLNYHYEPMIQIDLSFSKFKLSVAAEHQFQTLDDITEGSPYLNGEITASIFEHTDLIIFAGKQKGGKVCRNGVCRYESQFEGAKIELTTKF